MSAGLTDFDRRELWDDVANTLTCFQAKTMPEKLAHAKSFPSENCGMPNSSWRVERGR
jgi:hypothetical protein